MDQPYLEIERAVRAALATYSNVHRGSGHHAQASTRLYEQAKEIVLDHLGLDRRRHVVVFASPRRGTSLTTMLAAGTFHVVSSADLGLPIGIRAIAIERKALPRGIPVESGGGTARLISADWVLWEKGAERFEAGTPAIVNAIALSRTLQIIARDGANALHDRPRWDEDERDELDQLAGRALLDRLRPLLVGHAAQVPTAAGLGPYVNLDNAASTPTFEPIWKDVRRAWRLPASQRAAIVDQAKAICASVLGAPLATYDLIFTSNTTEAINLVATSMGKAPVSEVDTVVLTTYLEHNSNELPWRFVRSNAVVRLPVSSEGAIDLAGLEAQLHAYNDAHTHGRQRITLVAVSGASNVLGVFPPLAEISRLAHQYGAKILVDAAQLVAHRHVAMDAWGIDYLAFSGHKVYAPFGTGVLVARKGLLSYSPAELDALCTSGEENIGGIAGLAKALTLLARIGFDVIRDDEQALLKRALGGLAKLPNVKVHGTRDPESPRLGEKAGMVIFDVKGRLPGRVARELAERAGVGVRYGCHCAHLLIKRLLKVPPWAERLQYFMLKVASGMSLPGVVRISFGLATTSRDVDIFLDAMKDIALRAPSKSGKRTTSEFVEATCRTVFPTTDSQ